MQLTVHQTITIYHFRIGSISNASVLQVGSAGVIKAQANLFNTGGFTAPAPQVPSPTTKVTTTDGAPGVFVPLPAAR